jgi:hypothetical protein
MQRRSVIRTIGDIASKGCDLNLLIDRDALVFLGLPVEIAKDRRTESTNSAELCRFDLFPFDEALQGSHHLIPAAEHNDKTTLLPCLIDQSRLHETAFGHMSPMSGAYASTDQRCLGSMHTDDLSPIDRLRQLR